MNLSRLIGITLLMVISNTGSARIPSWTELARRLAEFGIIDRLSFEKSDKLKHIATEFERPEMLAMIRQHRFPNVQVFGFHALAQTESKEALRSAMFMLLDADQPANLFYAPIYKEARNIEDQDWFNATCDGLFERTPRKIEAVQLLVSSFQKEKLQAWINATTSQRLSAENVALIFSEVLHGNTVGEMLGSERARARFAELANYPGLPRQVFLSYCKPEQKEVSQLLRLLFQNPDADNEELVFFVRANKTRLRKPLQNLGNQLEPERRKLIEAALLDK